METNSLEVIPPLNKSTFIRQKNDSRFIGNGTYGSAVHCIPQ